VKKLVSRSVPLITSRRSVRGRKWASEGSTHLRGINTRVGISGACLLRITNSSASHQYLSEHAKHSTCWLLGMQPYSSPISGRTAPRAGPLKQEAIQCPSQRPPVFQGSGWLSLVCLDARINAPVDPKRLSELRATMIVLRGFHALSGSEDRNGVGYLQLPDT